MDSRVAALARSELGGSFETFTWGEPDWPDVVEAKRVAAALGVPHRTYPPRWFADGEALDRVRREVRWSEGTAPAMLTIPHWPSHVAGYITGGGGETGRAFYYRWAAHRQPSPTGEELTDALLTPLLSRMEGAHDAAKHTLRGAVDDWLAGAKASGRTGWSLHDVVYAEQRLARWGRSSLPRVSAAVVSAFSTVGVSRGLASMPLQERLSDGFHRRFIAERAPELLPPPVARPRRGVPRFARRLAATARARRQQPSPWFGTPLWADRPLMHAWLADEVLTDPLFTEAVGPDWVARTRAGFLRGESDATQATLRAAGIAAAKSAIAADLPPD